MASYPYALDLFTVKFKFDTDKMIRLNTPMKKETYHHGDLRPALIKAAETVLETKGLEGFSLRAVAREVGVSHAAPAHHFKDTTGLLMALAEDGFHRFTEMMEAEQDQAEPDAKSRLVASAHGYVAFAQAHPALFRLMFSSQRLKTEDGEIDKIGGAAFTHLVRAVAAHEEGDAEAQPVIAAWSMVHGFAELLISGRMLPVQRMPNDQRKAFFDSVFRRLV